MAYVLEILWVHWIAPWLAVADPISTMHLALHPRSVVHGEVWQLATYLLVHDPTTPWHAIFNLVFCWLFGAGFEQRWGTWRILRFYVTCGVLAGLVVLGWSALMPGDWDKFTFGASGAVFALIAAFATLRPNALLWPIPIRAKTFVWALVALTVLEFLVRSPQSAAAHLGGLGAGWLMVTGNWRPGRWIDRLRLWRLKRRRARLTVVHTEDERRGRNGRILH